MFIRQHAQTQRTSEGLPVAQVLTRRAATPGPGGAPHRRNLNVASRPEAPTPLRRRPGETSGFWLIKRYGAKPETADGLETASGAILTRVRIPGPPPSPVVSQK